MLFDDRLATVLRSGARSETAARTQYRQLLDLLGSMPPGAASTLADAGYERLGELAGELPSTVQSAILRAPGLRLRNRAMTLTLVDPTYQGDMRCHGDRAGMLVDIPLVMPGYQLGFRQTAGFAPHILPIDPSFPIRVLRGPAQSIWVVDEGDFLSTSITQPSTRGRVFRVEPSALGAISTLE